MENCVRYVSEYIINVLEVFYDPGFIMAGETRNSLEISPSKRQVGWF